MGKYVTAGGVRTYYEKHGEGEPLLLMHCGACTIETFFGLTPELAKRYKVILPEIGAVITADGFIRSLGG